MSLVSEVNTARVENKLTLTSVPMHEVAAGNIRDPIEIRGRIAEKYVEMWLSYCPGVEFDRDFPRNVNGYSLEMQNSGVVVSHYPKGRKETKSEFDFLIYHHGRPAIVQVRSGGINSIESKIHDYLDLGNEIYSMKDIRMLLFFPIYQNKALDADRIRARFQQVNCINMGYKKRRLNAAVKRYFAETRIQPLKLNPGRS